MTHHLNVEKTDTRWAAWCDCGQWKFEVWQNWWTGRALKGEYGRALTGLYREHVRNAEQHDRDSLILELERGDRI